MAVRSGLVTGQVSLEPSREQERFARVVEVGTWLSVGLLVVGFALYLSGLVEAYVPIHTLPQHWELHAEEFIARTGVPAHWGWVRLLRHSDFMNLIGIVMLAGLPIIAYAAVLPLYARKRDTAYALITATAIAVLVLAASGLVAGGH
jgi:hypothetical protein